MLIIFSHSHNSPCCLPTTRLIYIYTFLILIRKQTGRLLSSLTAYCYDIFSWNHCSFLQFNSGALNLGETGSWGQGGVEAAVGMYCVRK